MLDYQASLDCLSNWLQSIKDSDWSPTPRVKELREFAAKLEQMAETMADPGWLDVETATDSDSYDIMPDGWPHPAEESSLGLYQHTKWSLKEIAATAIALADGYPGSRARPHLNYAAAVFLHIWLENGNDRPTLYDSSTAVVDFARVLQDGRCPLSRERVRGLLGDALKDFNSAETPPEMERFLVYSIS